MGHWLDASVKERAQSSGTGLVRGAADARTDLVLSSDVVPSYMHEVMGCVCQICPVNENGERLSIRLPSCELVRHVGSRRRVLVMALLAGSHT